MALPGLFSYLFLVCGLCAVSCGLFALSLVSIGRLFSMTVALPEDHLHYFAIRQLYLFSQGFAQE